MSGGGALVRGWGTGQGVGIGQGVGHWSNWLDPCMELLPLWSADPGHCRQLSSSLPAVREDDALVDALCELEAPRTLARIMDLHPNSRGTVGTSQLCTCELVMTRGVAVVHVSIPPTGIQRKACDVVCVLCELQLMDKMTDKVLMTLASTLITTMLNWKSEVEVLGKVSGKGKEEATYVVCNIGSLLPCK